MAETKPILVMKGKKPPRQVWHNKYVVRAGITKVIPPLCKNPPTRLNCPIALPGNRYPERGIRLTHTKPISNLPDQRSLPPTGVVFPCPLSQTRLNTRESTGSDLSVLVEVLTPPVMDR